MQPAEGALRAPSGAPSVHCRGAATISFGPVRRHPQNGVRQTPGACDLGYLPQTFLCAAPYRRSGPGDTSGWRLPARMREGGYEPIVSLWVTRGDFPVIPWAGRSSSEVAANLRLVIVSVSE